MAVNAPERKICLLAATEAPKRFCCGLGNVGFILASLVAGPSGPFVAVCATITLEERDAPGSASRLRVI
jgi:hypothetical protein